MKIGYTGLSLPEGKVKYGDTRMDDLVAKCLPKKITPFYVEFIKNDFVQTEVIVISEGTILDILILDMEKCETRIMRSEDPGEKELMEKCISSMELETPLRECAFSDSEQVWLRKLDLVSLKPIVQTTDTTEVNDVITQSFEKADMIFFYTAGPQEVHAWQVRKESDIVTCAGKIHTDLARGFIKGDVAGYDDFMQCHNFNDCRKKGLVKVVDRDHIVRSGDIIEIRFNV